MTMLTIMATGTTTMITGTDITIIVITTMTDAAAGLRASRRTVQVFALAVTIVSKRKDSPYRSGRSSDWLKMKNPACEAVRREAEEDWGPRPMRARRR